MDSCPAVDIIPDYIGAYDAADDGAGVNAYPHIELLEVDLLPDTQANTGGGAAERDSTK